ncbi:hypothetical protein JOE33_002692 [Pseudomonas sp. PvP027]|uniref:hypothetical protein n=1 Tax=Pseudomonas TaxID=286 RepID=UPI0016566D61|nr:MULTISPECIES: hypothetical protein [Pseudomonas]MBC8803173.1 hypothetical protein [Pseudomonas congelans]MBP1145769.1 hypothetical protein [Pseudomonas sp. PvP027]
MRAYVIAIIFVGAWHIYLSIIEGKTPLSMLFIILIMSPFLPYVWKEISNVKLSKDGISLEKLKADVDNTIKKATHRKAIDPKALDDLFKTVELNEWMTLVLARMLMRQGLVCLVPAHGLGPSPSLIKLIPLCLQENLISSEEADNLDKLREITFYAEWWNGRAPSHGQWRWALDNCKLIVHALFERQPIA